MSEGQTEIEKYDKHYHEIKIIADFLDDGGHTLVEWIDEAPYPMTETDVRKSILNYFGINPAALERERLELIEKIRDEQKESEQRIRDLRDRVKNLPEYGGKE